MIAFGAEQKPFQQVLSRAEPDSRIAKLVFLASSDTGQYGRLPVYDHFPSWHHLRGRGLVDFNFAAFRGMPVSYRDPAIAERPRDASGFDWEHHRGACYDYLLSRAPTDPFEVRGSPLSQVRSRVTLVASAGHWYLHENLYPVACQYPN